MAQPRHAPRRRHSHASDLGRQAVQRLPHFARHPHRDRLDQRRRRLAAETTSRLLRLAVRGEDGSATWITPESFGSQGWHVQPLGGDSYFGLGGVAVALAGYRHEVANGRADPVAGVDEALEGALLAFRSLISPAWGASVVRLQPVADKK